MTSVGTPLIGCTACSYCTDGCPVSIPIPEQYRKEGRKFCVIRYHNGTVDVLDDIGPDPDRIIFRTDKFSEYAIAYEAVNINRLILRFLIITGISLILAVICFAALIRYRRKARIAAREARVRAGF